MIRYLVNRGVIINIFDSSSSPVTRSSLVDSDKIITIISQTIPLEAVSPPNIDIYDPKMYIFTYLVNSSNVTTTKGAPVATSNNHGILFDKGSKTHLGIEFTLRLIPARTTIAKYISTFVVNIGEFSTAQLYYNSVFYQNTAFSNITDTSDISTVAINANTDMNLSDIGVMVTEYRKFTGTFIDLASANLNILPMVITASNP